MILKLIFRAPILFLCTKLFIVAELIHYYAKAFDYISFYWHMDSGNCGWITLWFQLQLARLCPCRLRDPAELGNKHPKHNRWTS